MRKLIIPLVLVLALVLFSRGEPEAKTPAVRFTEHLLKDNFGYAYGLAASDLDGDGLPDITTADADRGQLTLFRNRGIGKFTPSYIKDGEPGWFERHVHGDVNGDGKPDVVVVKNLHGHLAWFENPGKEKLNQPWPRHLISTDLHRAYDVALADLNGDGKPDVAASAWVGNHFAWFENPGKPGGEWKKHLVDDGIGETRAIHVADLNGDGRPDLVGTARTGKLLAWYENPGPPYQGKWKRHVIDDTAVYPTHGHLLDMDGDGDLDVILAIGFYNAPAGPHTNQVAWYENVGKPGKGTEWKKHVVGELKNAFEAAAGDLDGDGKPDVVATGWGEPGQVVVFLNPGDPKGKWSRHVLKDNWRRANSVLVVDLDKDGRLDIVAAAERGTNEVRWWRNEGKK
jgi:hypothetical protein